MHTVIHAEDIRVIDRQRKEFKEKELKDLADSIKDVGLIHAPVVNELSGRLIAGERRLKALALIKGEYKYGNDTYLYPDIPVHLIAREDENLLFKIELEENLRRVNLTPMEEAAAIAKLHKVRTSAKPDQTMRDTAQEVVALVGKKPTSHDETRVADALLIDQFKDDPEVQAAAKVSMRKAGKVARKKMEIDFLRALDYGEQEANPNPMFHVYPGDCMEIMKDFEDEYFDILLFDPPYGINADKFGEQAMDLGHQYKDDNAGALDLIGGILKESKRILKPNAHVLMFCAFEQFYQWKTIYEQRDFFVWPRPLIWAKGQQSHVPVPDYGPRYSYECILFASRGKRKINTLINDVISCPPTRDKIHAAEKPQELLGTLIDFVGRPGDKILDPTVGSGSIFRAARDREVYVTGIELNPDYYLVAKSRAEEKD